MASDIYPSEFERQDLLRETAGRVHPGPNNLPGSRFDSRQRVPTSSKFADIAVVFGDLHIAKGTMSGPVLRNAIFETPSTGQRDGAPHQIVFSTPFDLFNGVSGMEITDEHRRVWGELCLWANRVEPKKPEECYYPATQNPPPGAAGVVWASLDATPYVVRGNSFAITSETDSLFQTDEPGGEARGRAASSKRRKTDESSAPPSSAVPGEKRSADTADGGDSDEEDEDDEEEEEDEDKMARRDQDTAVFEALRALGFMNRSMMRAIQRGKADKKALDEKTSTADLMARVVTSAVVYVMHLSALMGELDCVMAARKLFRVNSAGDVVYPRVFSAGVGGLNSSICRMTERWFLLYVAALAPHTLFTRNALFSADFVNDYVRPRVSGRSGLAVEAGRTSIDYHEVPITDALECFNTNAMRRNATIFSDTIPGRNSDKGEYVRKFFENINSFGGFTVGALASSRLNYILQSAWASGSEVLKYLPSPEHCARFAAINYPEEPDADRLLPYKEIKGWHVIATKSAMYPSDYWGTLRTRDVKARIVDAVGALATFPLVWDGLPLFPVAVKNDLLSMALVESEKQRRSADPKHHPVVAALMKPAELASYVRVISNDPKWPHRLEYSAMLLAEKMWMRSNDQSNFVRALLPASDMLNQLQQTGGDWVAFYELSETGGAKFRRRGLQQIFKDVVEKQLFVIEAHHAARAVLLEARMLYVPAEPYVAAVELFDKNTDNFPNGLWTVNTTEFTKRCKAIRCNFEPQLMVIVDMPEEIDVGSILMRRDLSNELARLNALIHFALRYMEPFATGGDEVSVPAVHAHPVSTPGLSLVLYAFASPIDALFRRRRALMSKERNENALIMDSETLSDFCVSATDVVDRNFLGSPLLSDAVTWTGERFEMASLMGVPHAVWVERSIVVNNNQLPIGLDPRLPAVFEALLAGTVGMDRVSVKRTFYPGGETIDIKRYDQRIVCMDEIYKKHLLPNGFKWVVGPLPDAKRRTGVCSRVKWFWRDKRVCYYIYTPAPPADLKLIEQQGRNLHIVDIGLDSDIYFERLF